MVRFFQLLETAQNRRVLTEKAASKEVPQPTVISAGVDKLEARIDTTYTKTDLIKSAKKLGYLVKESGLKEKGRFLKVSKGDQVMHCQYIQSRGIITRLISNPNRFGEWGVFLKFLTTLFPAHLLEQMSVSRLDLNIDFDYSFKDLIESIDIKNKSLAIQYTDRSGVRTGMNIGKGNEYIVIYDKTKVDDIEKPRTRMELRLSGKKLPTKSIFDLPHALRDLQAFDFLSCHNLSFNSLVTRKELLERQQEFKIVLGREGYYAARKAFNLNRNFKRDFASLIELTNWTIQPLQLFQEHIKAFIGDIGHCKDIGQSH
ncbi:MAG: hypothetical protein VX583_03150 [Bdellovibrionota bacterium]